MLFQSTMPVRQFRQRQKNSTDKSIEIQSSSTDKSSSTDIQLRAGSIISISVALKTNFVFGKLEELQSRFRIKTPLKKTKFDRKNHGKKPPIKNAQRK